MGYLLILIGMLSAPADDASIWNPEVEEEAETNIPFVWDLRLQMGLHAAGKDPETGLPLYEDDNPLSSGIWAIDDFLKPRSDVFYPWFLVEFGLEAEFYKRLGVRLTLSTGEIHNEDGEWLTSRRSAKDDGTTEIGGRTVGEEFLASGFVREAVLTGRLGPVSLEAGQRIGEVMGGLVYGDYGLGIAANLDMRDLDLGPWSVSMAADLVGQEWADYTDPNTLLSMRVEWEYGFFESLVFEAAYFGDRTGTFHDALSSIQVENAVLNPSRIAPCPPQAMMEGLNDPLQCYIWGFVNSQRESTVDVGYVGVSGNHFFNDLSLRYSLALEQGSAVILAPETPENEEGPEPGGPPGGPGGAQQSDSSSDQAAPEDVHFLLQGFAMDINAHYSLTPRLGLSAFGVFLSGQGPPPKFTDDGDRILSAFIAPAPYWVWSRMFFTGGLSQGVFSSRATTAGINAHGVAAAGLAFDWSGSFFEVSGRALWLEAMCALSGDEVDGEPTHYGLETNLEGRFLIWDGSWFDLYGNAELDFFFPGNFFPESDVAYRAIGLLDVVLRD